MGDTFQAVVDVDATEHDAPGLAAKAIDWLANRGVIESTPTDCVLGPLGYRPGENCAIAVLTTDDNLMGWRVNGLGGDRRPQGLLPDAGRDRSRRVPTVPVRGCAGGRDDWPCHA